MVRFLMIVVGEFQELGQSSWWESFRAAVSETGGESPSLAARLITDRDQPGTSVSELAFDVAKLTIFQELLT